MRVAVIGAGIGGLCTAIGLQRAGAQVTVYERAPVLSPIGSGLSIFPNGSTALRALGLGDAFASITADGAAHLRAGQRKPDGTWLATIPPEAVSGLRVVHRADLHQILVDALDPGTLQLGISATTAGAEGTPRVELEGGDVASVEADLVVAADGINSAVRRSWPADPGLRYSGYSSWRGVTSRPVDLLGAAGETWGTGLRFGMAPLRDGRVYWFGVASMPADDRTPDEFAAVRRLFEHWHDPIPALLDATDPAAVFRHPINDLAKPLPTFRRGGVVLLGDAAHAMTPDLGQGANQAMEDAATLAALLAPLAAASAPDPGSIDHALSEYDRLRRARTQPIARRARSVGALAHVKGRLGVGVRNAVLRLTPASALGRQATAVQQWAPPATDVAPRVGDGSRWPAR